MKSVELQKYLPISIFEFSLLKTKYVDFKHAIIDKEMIDDDDISRYFSEYKQKTGFKRSPKYKKETPYRQDTFYRNTRNSEINEKSIYNARQPFVEACGDKRFSGTKIYDSGRYYQMFKAECSYNDEFSASDKGSCEIINKIFNDNLSYSQTTSIIRDYMKYKETYLHTM